MKRRAEAHEMLDAFERASKWSLNDDNRWVARALTIPWDALRAECAQGAGDDFRMLFSACLVQAQFGYTDEEALEQIKESPYLQFFCGLSGYDSEKPPFSSDDLTRFRVGLSAETLRRINEIIKSAARTHGD